MTRVVWLAAFAACIALVYPPLVGVAFTDFHENGFAPAAIVWLAWALDAAVGLYADPASWRQLMANGMRQDFSWKRQGALYELLYERMVAGG